MRDLDLRKWMTIIQRVIAPPSIAQTPSEVVYRENKLRLLHYVPATPRPFPIPVLIVSSLINKYYILDLRPGRSYVEYLVKRGFRVYMIDWGIPDARDRTLTLDDHINGYLTRCVQSVLRHARASTLTLIGYCMGGTMALIYAALHRRPVRNLVLLATPVDFHNQSLLSLWSRPQYFNVDRLVDVYGNVPAEILYGAFMMLKPMRNITKYVDLLARLDDEEFINTFQAFNYWIRDTVPVPGETFRQFVTETYHHNRLVNSRMVLGGERVRLEKVICSVLNVVAERDEIVPPASSIALMELINSRDKELLTVPGGHHSLSIGRSAMRVVWPISAEWLKRRSQT